jgi:hypothetical protein
VMLYQPRNVRLVFRQKYGLAQPNCLSPVACLISSGLKMLRATRNR